MTPEAKQLIVHLRRETMRDYLMEIGLVGGTENEFIGHVLQDHVRNPTDYPLAAMLAVCARAAWRQPAPWEKRDDDEAAADEDRDLFSVAGFKLDREVTIPDPIIRTRQRKVLTEIAPIAFQREDAIITMEKGAQVSKRGLEAMRAYHELLKRANGDPQQLISKFADRREPKRKPKSTATDAPDTRPGA
jgi:hypothetical protein